MCDEKKNSTKVQVWPWHGAGPAALAQSANTMFGLQICVGQLTGEMLKYFTYVYMCNIKSSRPWCMCVEGA